MIIEEGVLRVQRSICGDYRLIPQVHWLHSEEPDEAMEENDTFGLEEPIDVNETDWGELAI